LALGREETAALLREVPAAYGADVSEALLAALARAYGLVSGWPGLFVTVEGHGREPLFADVDLTRTVGWFTTQYPIWLAWRDAGGDGLATAPGSWHPGRALMAVKERVRSIPNRGLGYGVLRYLSGDPEIEQELAAQPRPAISLNYLGQLGSGRENAGPGPVFRISQRPRGSERAAEMPLPHLLEVSAAVQEGQLWLAWTYDSRRLALAEVQHLARETIRALQELVAHSSTPEAAGYTPSDFPQAGLTQAEIDALMEEIGH
jgi:non-ribosomal peptide synthase protein (TIGR01720 family)